ncbi:hypothetical protein [Natronomonas sp.]|uniref:hypothetical protein n=1 Tax=Natronomonas sp. TaxID=2184060 RepID=UPI002FC33922
MPLSNVDAEETNLPGWAAGVLLLVGTVSVAGLADYVLTNAGFELLGTLVWAFCYGTALFVVWTVWLRDIELTGQTDDAGRER